MAVIRIVIVVPAFFDRTERAVDNPVLNDLGEGRLGFGENCDDVPGFVVAASLPRRHQPLIEAMAVSEIPTGQHIAKELPLALDPGVKVRQMAHQTRDVHSAHRVHHPEGDCLLDKDF